MTGVGYGDVTARTVGERLFSIFAMLVGASLFGFIIGMPRFSFLRRCCAIPSLHPTLNTATAQSVLDEV